jgi:hypothetical protein
MPDEFDGQAAAAGVAAALDQIRTAAEKVKTAEEREPLFRTLTDGSLVDRNGQVIRGPVKPLELKGK